MSKQLNSCDQPFGESYSEFLAKRTPIGSQKKPWTKPELKELPAPTRPPQPGEYIYKTTSDPQAQTWKVILITKSTPGPWHPIKEILGSMGYKAPLGHDDSLDHISPREATLRVYTD